MTISDVNPIPQMFSRWWLLFFGFILVPFGIAYLAAANRVEFAQGGLVATGIIWLLVAVIALYIGFAVRDAKVVRWSAGIIGGLFFAWGIIYLYTGPSLATIAAATVMSTVGGLLILMGALGLAAAIVPANYLYEEHERRTMAT